MPYTPHLFLYRHAPRAAVWLGMLWLLAAFALQAAPPDTRTRVLAVDGERWPLTIPEGFELELLTTALDGPRLMHFLPNGDLLIGSRSGDVYRLPPPYREAEVLITLPDYPHSVAWRNGTLFIAQTHGLYKTPYAPGQRRIREETLQKLAALPGGGGHTSRTVAVGPDQRVYLALGITGNCSDEYLDDSYAFEKRRGGVLVLDESQRPPRWVAFASGLRNPVGIDWHPASGVLYASNNGPDHQGFELPPESFSRLTPGSFHGMPWYQYDGKALQRDRCIGRHPPRAKDDVSLPVATFPARNAPMGVAFVPRGALGGRFTHDAIVALRGSWGTQPRGHYLGDPATRRPPRIMRVPFAGETPGEPVDIVSGFQREDGERLARPVGVAFGPDGALYFTSDSGVQGLYRLRPAPKL